MKKIPLTKGYFALVDDSDYEWLNQWKWQACKSKHTVYAIRMIRRKDLTKQVWMHREIMKTPDDKITDHKDGNGLNNQRHNLKICTYRQNNQNVHVHKSEPTDYPGVKCLPGEKYTAEIYIDGKTVNLGVFDSEIAAFRAYYDACIDLGEPPLHYSYPTYPAMKYYPDMPQAPQHRLTWREKKYEYRKTVEFPIWKDRSIAVYKKLV